MPHGELGRSIRKQHRPAWLLPAITPRKARGRSSVHRMNRTSAKSLARGGAAFALAAILGTTAATGTLVPGGATTPASAADLSSQVLPSENAWAFTDPSGTNWTVPVGVERVVVALQGGTGGRGVDYDRTPASWLGNGHGDDFLIDAQVTPGDKLTIYAGRHAHGSKDASDGGAGFVNGGTGGKGSLDGQHAGGGGGAAALKINGELIAVAGGGGGGGGFARSWQFKCPKRDCSDNGHFDIRKGGNGGNAETLRLSKNGYYDDSSAGTGGTNPGARGGPYSKRYMPGGKGGSGGFSTAAGGGGGGGGGFPHSGTGGGAGKGFMGSNAGGGGAAGSSFIIEDRRYTLISGRTNSTLGQWRQREDLTNMNPSGVIIPIISQVKLIGPTVVRPDTDFSLRLHATQQRTPGKSIYGWYTFFHNDSEFVSMRTSGNERIPIPTEGLPVGTHTFKVRFTPDALPTDPAQGAELFSSPSEATLEVRVIDPISLQSEDNDQSSISGEDQPSDESDASDQPDETNPPSTSNSDDGSGADAGEVPVTSPEDAEDAAADDASTDQTDARGGADTDSPDVSALDAVPATTTTAFTSAPASARAFDPINVTAEVTTTGTTTPTGQVELLADGMPFAYTNVDASGVTTFTDVVPPVDATVLSAAFIGDEHGSFAESASAESPITITDLETETTLTVSPASIFADETATFVAIVRNTDPTASEDPRGEIEFLVDGEEVAAIGAGLDSDADANDGDARYELEVSALTLGAHDVVARFVPADGFGTSDSEAEPLQVLGVETTLTATPNHVKVTSEEQTVFDLAVGVTTSPNATSASSADGYVQAFESGIPIGDIAVIENGVGTLSLPVFRLGEHELDLRFTPANMGQLKSSTTVTVTAIQQDSSKASEETKNDAVLPPRAGRQLATTGSNSSVPWLVVGSAALLLGLAAGAAGLIRGRRKQTQV